MTDTVDVAIDPNLLVEACVLGIDVEAELEHRLRESVAKRKRQIAWHDENRVAIEAWNEQVERVGLWYERFRDR
jgi:post-segregation antitoxin (ccd killing protein)